MTTKEKTRDQKALDSIRDALKNYRADVVLSDFKDWRELRRAYEMQDGGTFYFSRDTVRFFGSSNFHMVAPGMLCETMRNAPTGTVWKITAWIYCDDRLTACNLDYLDSLGTAETFGKRAARVWRSAVLAGANLTGAVQS